MDMTESIIPRSDQINADELVGGPATYTIREVIVGKAEHPFDFLLVETDRAYRPSKTMRRVIVNAWGSEAANYAGRRLTLYREPSIMFGGQKVGGIRISHMSDIAGPVEVMAQTTRGKREKFLVQPLAALPTTEGGDPLPVVDAPNSQDGGQDTNGGSASEAAEPPTVPLRVAINTQIRAMQTDGGSAFLTTWAQAHDIKPSSAAIEERFGEEARDLPGLMAKYPTDVVS